jgi:formate hydrogenlyase transcriptional activator
VELEHLRSELQRSEAYLTEAQRLSHTGSFGWSVPAGEISWSDETFRIFEYDRADKPSLELVLQRVHPDDRALVRQTLDRASNDSAGFDYEHRLLMPDGRVKHLHIVADALRDSSGAIEFVGAVMDITAAKQAEDRPRLVLDTTPTLIHTARPDGYLDFFNRTWLRYAGLSLEDLQGWKWAAAIHAEDVEGMVNKWRASIASGEPALYEARVRRADGEYRWMLHHTIAERDEHGKIVKWYGSSIDIDDRKQAEARLRQDEMELRQMLDLTPQHVHVLTAEGSLVYSNEMAVKFHGDTLDDWRGRPFSQWQMDELPVTLFHPDDRERVMNELKDKLSSGSPHQTEARLLRNDARYVWFLYRFNPLRDERDRVLRWYVAGTDIEDRKQAEERLQHENVALREEIDKTSMFEEIVGTSAGLQTVISRISKVAPTDSTVLITGETGTGKELVARAIHRRSHRSSRAFVAVNCAAIPRDLIASELFGHEKGAFTGAIQRHVGRFELAEGGTIFLDEVGDLPAETQIALLRVLQEHEFERVGGTRSIQANVRVIAATNRDLQAATEAGIFRSDLLYRLNVFPIEIPPLRERREDIPLLVEYFIDRYARQAGKKRIRGVNKKSLDLLQSYPWPGNIRELQNVIERSVIVCETETFSVDESWLSRQPHATEPRNSLDLTEKLAAQEKEMIEAALRECGGRVFGPSGAAARLGMPRSTLESKIRSLKINKNYFKSAASSKNN